MSGFKYRHRFFLILSFCSSSSFVNFKNSPDNFTRWTAEVFIRLMKIQLYSLVLSKFFVPLKYSFFFHLRLFNGACSQYYYFFVSFLFSECSDLSWFGSSIPSVNCRFSAFHYLVWHIFLWHILSSYPHCIFLLPVLEFPILFLFWQTVWCRTCTWLIICSCNLWSLYHFLCDWKASLLLLIIIVIAHLPGRFLFPSGCQFHTP